MIWGYHYFRKHPYTVYIYIYISPNFPGSTKKKEVDQTHYIFFVPFPQKTVNPSAKKMNKWVSALGIFLVFGLGLWPFLQPKRLSASSMATGGAKRQWDLDVTIWKISNIIFMHLQWVSSLANWHCIWENSKKKQLILPCLEEDISDCHLMLREGTADRN